MIQLSALIHCEDNIITKILGLQYKSSNFWTIYRKIIAALQEGKLSGKKISNKWYVENEEDLKFYIKKLENEVTFKVNPSNANKEITILEIKTLISDLLDCKASNDVIVSMLIKKLNIY